MKTIFLRFWAVLICYAFSGLYSQSVTITDSAFVPFDQMMDSVFEHVSLAAVTSHHLISRAPVLMPIERFHGGTGADTAVFRQWQSLYATLHLAAITPAAQLPTPENGYVPLVENLSSQDPIPLAVLHYNYHYLDSLALDDNLLTVQGVQLFDVPNRPRSPFLAGTLFIAAPVREVVYTLTPSFTVRDNLYYDNSDKTLSQIRLDAGDGQGFRTISLNEALNASYITGGEKILRLRLSFTDGTARECASRIQVNAPSANGRYSNTQPDATFTVTATRDGVTAQALVSVTYGCGHTQLVRPFIFVEGTQPAGAPGTDQSFENFFDEGRMPAQVREEFEEGGYDLVYVDFAEDGGQAVVVHAELVKEVLREINLNRKVGDEPNVLLGGSTGGVSSRIALAEMELANEPTETRLLISFDSGAQGDNVPLGLQHMIRHVLQNSILGLIPGTNSIGNALQAPGSQDMLIYQAFAPNNLLPQRRVNLQAYLNTLVAQGLPQNTKLLAISNGSQTGQGQGFNPGDEIGDIQATLLAGLIYNVVGRFRIWAVPNNTAANIYSGWLGVRVFYISIHYLPPRRVEVSGTRPYDSAPGGAIPLGARVANVGGLGNDLLNLIDILPFNQVTFVNRACFAATVSGLDLQPAIFPNLGLNVQNAQVITNGLTPFEDYTAPTGVVDPVNNLFNEIHVEYTPHVNAFLIRHAVGQNDFNDVPGTTPVALNTTYNFGRGAVDFTVSQLVKSVQVNSGGNLWVNDPAPIGFASQNLNPTLAGSAFPLEVAGETACFGAVTVSVGSGGQMKLGESGGSPSPRTATVRFSSGSRLELLPGSTLRIHNNSRLVIEPGATLRIESDAQIELLGDNAVLEIRGNLELGPYALLRFTGSGFIRLGMAVQGTTNVQLFGTGQRLELHGSGPTDKVLEIMDFTAWYPDYDIDMTIITDGKVELGAGAWLDTGNGEVVFSHTHFTAITPDAAHRYHTIYINGQSNQFLHDLEFSWGFRGLSARNNLSNGASPTIWESQFHDCTTGLYSEGKGLTLNNVQLYNNTTGWQGVGHTFGGNFVNSQANTNGAGILFTGNSNLTLTTSQVNDNGSGVYYAGTGSVTGSCGEVRDNFSYGILASNNGSVNFSSQKKMNLSGNAPSISLSQASNLYLSNGRNNLIPASGSKAVIGTFSGSITAITATRNQWNTRIPPGNPIPNPGQPPVSGLDYTLTNGSGAAVTLTDNQPFVFAPCGGGNPSGLMVQSEPCTNCPTVQTPHVPGLRLDLALNQALANLADSLPAVRAMGVTQLSEILDHAFPYGVNHPRLRRLLDLGWLELRDYTARERAADTLPVDSSLHTPILTGRLALLRAAVNRRRLQHQAAGDSVRAFYLATDHALLYEWAGRTGKALQQLENLQSPNRTPEEQEYLDHWICHLRAKQQYRQGLLTPLQWDSLIQICPLPSAVSPIASGTALRLSAPTEPEIILYPNPATDRLYIAYTPVGIPDDHARLRATLHNLQGGEEGEILPSQGVFAGNNEWEVSTAHLPAGMYLVRIFTGEEMRTFKLVIVR